MKTKFNYEIIINRKNIKNTYIRVRDGKVIVNTGKRTSKRRIKEILESREEWISKNLSKYENVNDIDTLEGKKISILGKEYIVKIIKNTIDKVYIEDFYVILETDGNLDVQVNIINKLLKKEFMNILAEHLVAECRLIGERENLPTDFSITSRVMKTQFGSYSKVTNRICLNVCLIKYSEDIIKSVMLHEMAHLRHMNHGKRFYELLYRLCPEYDEYNRFLKRHFAYSKCWFLK